MYVAMAVCYTFAFDQVEYIKGPDTILGDRNRE